MIKGFKDFIMRGNVIDLAVAVVIGAAFGALVTAVVEGLINPLVAAAFNADEISGAVLSIGTVDLGIGAIISALITFLSTALVVYFVFVYPMNKFKERQAARVAAPEEDALPTEQELLIQIRDLLEKRNV